MWYILLFVMTLLHFSLLMKIYNSSSQSSALSFLITMSLIMTMSLLMTMQKSFCYYCQYVWQYEYEKTNLCILKYLQYNIEINFTNFCETKKWKQITLFYEFYNTNKRIIEQLLFMCICIYVCVLCISRRARTCKCTIEHIHVHNYIIFLFIVTCSRYLYN